VTLPTVELSSHPLAEFDTDVVVIGVSPGDEGLEIADPSLTAEDRESLLSAARALGMKATADETRQIPAPSGWKAETVVLVGIARNIPDAAAVRYAAGAGVRAAGSKAAIGVSLPGEGPLQTQAAVEGALLGGYRFHGAKAKKDDAVDLARVVVRGALDDDDLKRAVSTAKSVYWVRDRVNTPPNELYPAHFADLVSTACAELPIEVEVWDEERLAQDGFGGILGVGGGSQRPPRLVALRYRPEGATAHVALVGKGITFDSGGLSLKPAASMVGMKYDMTGSATVAGVIMAAAELGAPVSITAWMCLAENMPSGTALRPNDVITIRGGKTVEVLNTDAEGRLVLADGLQAASEENPDLIVDVATLTGAARVALGERYAGLMGHEGARELVQEAAANQGELVWPMPLPEELRKGLESDVADIANVATGSTLGGMLVAGLFLREFVGEREVDGVSTRIPWAHLDIAGPASNSSGPYGHTPKGPTGAVVRTLIELVLDSAEKGLPVPGQ
jgi:leucyl aminopeptidase